jgi:hypothetical protein
MKILAALATAAAILFASASPSHAWNIEELRRIVIETEFEKSNEDLVKQMGRISSYRSVGKNYIN